VFVGSRQRMKAELGIMVVRGSPNVIVVMPVGAGCRVIGHSITSPARTHG
jgi:hypothetical protein